MLKINFKRGRLSRLKIKILITNNFSPGISQVITVLFDEYVKCHINAINRNQNNTHRTLVQGSRKSGGLILLIPQFLNKSLWLQLPLLKLLKSGFGFDSSFKIFSSSPSGSGFSSSSKKINQRRPSSYRLHSRSLLSTYKWRENSFTFRNIFKI